MRVDVAARAVALAALVYPPPYNSDLKPIELSFSKLKGLVGNESPRTIVRLLSFLGPTLDDFRRDECLRYF